MAMASIKQQSSSIDHQREDDSTTLRSINPFAVVLGVAGLASIFTVVKDFVVAHPVVVGIAGIGVVIGIILVVRRVFFPHSLPLRMEFEELLDKFLYVWYTFVPISWCLKALESKHRSIRRSAADALEKQGLLTNEHEVKKYIADLKDYKDWTRESVVEAMIEMGKPVVSALIKAMEDEDDFVRKSVAKALGEIGDKQAVPALVEALEKEDKYDRRSAIEALEKMGALTNEHKVKKYIADLKYGRRVIRVTYNGMVTFDDDLDSVSTAATALGEIEDREAVPALIEALEGKYGYKLGYYRRDIVEALGKLEDKRAIPVLIKVLKVPGSGFDHHWLCNTAIEALVKIGKSAVPALEEALKDESSQLRKYAAEAFEKLRPLSDKEKFEKCIRDLEAEDDYVRASAMEELEEMDALTNEHEVKKYIADLEYSDGDRYDRRTAAEALGKIGDKRTLSILLKTLKDKDGSVRRSAAKALGKIGDRKAVPALIKTLEDEKWFVRESAEEALEELGALTGELKAKQYVPDNLTKELQIAIGLQAAITQIDFDHVVSWELRDWCMDFLGGDVELTEEAIKTRIERHIVTTLEKCGQIKFRKKKLKTHMVNFLSKIALNTAEYPVSARQAAVTALRNIGGAKAKEAIEKAMEDPEMLTREVRLPLECTKEEAIEKIIDGISWVLETEKVEEEYPDIEETIEYLFAQIPELIDFLRRYPLRLFSIKDRRKIDSMMLGNFRRYWFRAFGLIHSTVKPSGEIIEEIKREVVIREQDSPVDMGIGIELFRNKYLLAGVIYHEYFHYKGILSEGEVLLRQVNYMKSIIAKEGSGMTKKDRERFEQEIARTMGQMGITSLGYYFTTDVGDDYLSVLNNNIKRVYGLDNMSESQINDAAEGIINTLSQWIVMRNQLLEKERLADPTKKLYEPLSEENKQKIRDLVRKTRKIRNTLTSKKFASILKEDKDFLGKWEEYRAGGGVFPVSGFV